MDDNRSKYTKLLEIKGLSKAFAGIRALDNVDFFLNAGEVNVLLGENGAGKSTLIKLITGALTPDQGEILLEGKAIQFKDPLDAQMHGINAVYQEFNLIPSLTVYENIFITQQIKKKVFPYNLDREAMSSESKRILQEIGADIDVNLPIKKLGIAQRQMVEIAKALCHQSKIIIFDEPSAVLTETETRQLLDIVNRLRRQGMGIIYITHRLDEIFQICDSITILRDGKLIQRIDTHMEKITLDEVITLMVGRSLDEKYPKKFFPFGKEILRIENLSCKGKFRNVNFTLHRGEVLGICGLVGAGRTEVAKTIFGVYEKSAGDIYLNGEKLEIHSPVDAIRYGISLVSEDRKDEGLIQKMPINQNMMLVDMKRFQRHGSFNNQLIASICGNMAERLQLNTRNLFPKVSSLSGGNQQKVALSKWLIADCKVMIMDEPTRGVDVGAKIQIYNIINDLVEQGVGVIIISSEMPEALGMCDRIVVMCEGNVTGILNRKEATQEKILRLASGQEM